MTAHMRGVAYAADTAICTDQGVLDGDDTRRSAGLLAWGGARMEALLHRHVDRLGWATVALVVIGAALYQGLGTS